MRINMGEVRRGDNVKVHYTGKLTDGTVFDSSEGKDPLEFAVGAGQVIQGFEEGVVGMKVGESKNIEIPAAKAYGERNEEMIMEVPMTHVPPEIKPEIGMRLEVGGQNGEIIRVVIVDITEKSVILDANAPLAGKDLIFEIELIDCCIG
jgi:peptidylprolyl isomerase